MATNSIKTEKEQLRIVRCVNETELSWCVLAYVCHDTIKYKMFRASKIEWDEYIETNIRENFFSLEPDEIPLFVARCFYTLTRSQIEDYLKTESGRADFFLDYSERVFVVTDDKGERAVSYYIDSVHEEEQNFIDRYENMVFGEPEEI